MRKKRAYDLKALRVIENQQLKFDFLPTGDLFSATNKDIQINQVLGNELDGSMNNIYLRIHRDTEIVWTPLLGKNSTARFSKGTNSAQWQGEFEGVTYGVTLSLVDNIWFWQLALSGKHETVDVVYTQDIGLANIGALQANEAYISQYIDQKVLQDEHGFKLCLRQNQQQSTGNPYLQQGVIGDMAIDGYSTDGFQFFGKEFKFTGIPEALGKKQFVNKNYQYEFTFTALKTQEFKLDHPREFAFYGFFKADLPYAIHTIEFSEQIETAYQKIQAEPRENTPLVTMKCLSEEPLNGLDLTPLELATYYPERIHEEFEDGLSSCFTPSGEHVVFAQKERLVERPHGHILLSGNSLSIKDSGIATTSYIYGLFNSQIVLGNTSMNKLLTNQRNHLNFFKVSGQRMYVKIDGSYRRFNMPSSYEMGFNYVKWIYKLPDETFIIKNVVANQEKAIQLELSSSSGKAYDFLITNQIIMNESEFKCPFYVESQATSFEFSPSEESIIAQSDPSLRFTIQFPENSVELLDNSELFSEATLLNDSLVVFKLAAAKNITMKIAGTFVSEAPTQAKLDFTTEVAAYRRFIDHVRKGLDIQGCQEQETLQRINTVSKWYTHNMLIHYLSPHGLEQYGGAAWGTRDVCQGPVEFFLATQNFEVVREILLELFSHQFIEDGNWPQWFMFANYSSIFADESHGDIIVWPLFAIGEYLEATGDYSILDEKVGYLSRETHQPTTENVPIHQHIQKEIAYIKNHFLFGTHLSAYGDGDWDDTLQPANQSLKKQMVSSWTVALTYQALKKFGEVLASYDAPNSKAMFELAKNIETDYRHYILSDTTLPGFIYMHENREIDFIIHPNDQTTNIDYRLLPMTRSIISELLDQQAAEHHLQIIEDKLTFNDGVRLMNHPAPYSGGVSVHFKRAEQAANFGREVGLLYVHAQIRYVEAMCKYGKKAEAWKALNQVIPINLSQYVTNALPRQSNAYFSSSDGAFNDRYQAAEHFDDLRDGKVAVKGGWRVYSSGPGIFMNQLITNVLGIRKVANGMLFDPMLPNELSEVVISFELCQTPVKIKISQGSGNSKIMIDGAVVETSHSVNRYRKGGLFVTNEQLKAYIKENSILSVEV